MIIPSLIVSLMTLLGFALPVESGEKVTLGKLSNRKEKSYSIHVFLSRNHNSVIRMRLFGHGSQHDTANKRGFAFGKVKCLSFL
jgi:hypothetical protein